ncbi:hypothetical protein EV05_0073 [Prochlorococcus sp. MIT 0601]|nr:hypothetical protein EV05_0073 [Prochlorococcus sp. MIT 0601]
MLFITNSSLLIGISLFRIRNSRLKMALATSLFLLTQALGLRNPRG